METASYPDIYRKLFEHLSVTPISVPDLPQTFEILQLVFTEAEAALALNIPLVTAGRVSLEQLCDDSNMEETDISALLQDMLEKKLLLPSSRGDQHSYALWDFFFYITDIGFGQLKNSPTQIKLAALREELWQAGFNHELFASAYPFVRALPYDEHVGEGEHTHDYERAIDIVGKAKSVALMSNACHVAASLTEGLKDNGCEHQASGGYLCFNASADYFVEHHDARYIDETEVKEVFATAKSQGRVLTTFNAREHVPNICMCCPDCCIHFREINDSGNKDGLMPSDFTPVFSEKLI